MFRIRVGWYFFILALILAYIFWPADDTPNQKVQSEQAVVSMFINFGDREIAFENISILEGQNLFEVLKSIEGLEVIDTLYSGIGHLILGFNGVSNNAKHWIYCLNGNKSAHGVDLLELENGDQVTWHFTSESNACKK